MRKEIDLKYKIPVVGVYNSAVFECPCCGLDICNEFYNHVVGFADAYIGLVKVTECPKCHEKYYSHASDSDYSHFLYAIKNNRNIHNNNCSQP